MLFDILTLIIVAVGCFLGFRRGLMAQVGSVFGILAGIICCNIFGHEIAAHFLSEDDGVETLLLVNAMTYVSIFVVCYLLGRLCGHLIAGAMRVFRLGIVNRLCGAAFTVFEYLLVFSLLLNAFVGAFPNTRITSDYEGVKKFVLNLGPEVLGSETIGEIYDKVQNIISDNDAEPVANS